MFLKIVLFAFISINLGVPGGDIFNINIKLIFLILLSALTIAPTKAISLSKLRRVSLVKLLFLLLLAWVIASSIVAIVKDVNYFFTVMELRVVLPVFFIPAIFWLLHARKANLSNLLLVSFIVSITFFSVTKIIIELLFVLQVIGTDSITAIYALWGGEKPVYSPMPFGMIRIFLTKPDFVLAISPVILFLLRDRIRYKKFMWLSLAMITFAIIIAYSRALFVIFVTSILLGILLAYRITRILHTFLPLLIVILAVGSSLPFFTELYAVRVSADYSASGDSVRWEQISSMLQKWSENLVIGSGIGSNADLVRTHDLAFVYEVWLLSFFMKTGLIGCVLFLVFIFACNLNLMQKWLSVRRIKLKAHPSLALLIVLNMTVLLSFTNPYLPSTVTATLLGTLIYMHLDFHSTLNRAKIYLNESNHRK